MVFLDHVQNLHIHAGKTHKDVGAHCMTMLILYMVHKNYTDPYYRVQASFMYGVLHVVYSNYSFARNYRPCPLAAPWLSPLAEPSG